jgi:DNA-binding transcriptional ArsR family regulator
MGDHLHAVACARYLKALADPARLRIVEGLLTGQMTVSAIAEQLDVDLANASHHLQVLLHAGLVDVAREGKFSRYSLNPALFVQGRGKKPDRLEFGCCRVELGQSTGR